MRILFITCPLLALAFLPACAGKGSSDATDSTVEDVSADKHACAPRPRSFKADRAKGLIQAMMFAGVKPSSHSGTASAYVDTYTMDELSCQDGHAYDDGIARYDCVTPDTGEDDARAKVLFDAIYALKIAGDAGLGHTFADVSKVSCTLKVGNEASYACTVTGMWASDCDG
jgi:hypothetical protein